MPPRRPARFASFSSPGLACAAALFLGLTLAPSPVIAGAEGVLDLETINQLLSRAEPGQEDVRFGDMRFPISDLRARRNALIRQSSSSMRAPRSAVTTTVNLWPGGIVPYRFAPDVTATQRSQFLAACREWEAVANVKFIPATTQVGFVRVFNGGGNFATVGFYGGEQVLSMFNWDWKFIICHELAHTLGVWHEQNRSDRDTYVTIQTANIQPGQEHNFAKLRTTNRRRYDFDSVMHYGPRDFSINNQPTIVPKPAYVNDARNMGQLRFLSPLDIAGMIDLYGPSGAVPQLNQVGSVKVLDPLGNANGRLDRNEFANLQITVRNGGAAMAGAVNVTVTENSPYATIGNGSANLGDIGSGASVTNATLSLNVGANAPFGHIVPLTFTYTAGDQQWQATARLPVALLDPPLIQPPGGTFSTAKTVEITTIPAGLPVHYTINGGTPTVDSPVYQGPFTVADNAVVRAIAITEDETPSDATAASFVIARPVVPFDARLNFTNGQPTGWTLDIDATRADQLTWENQRLEVFNPEAVTTLERPLPLPGSALGVRAGFNVTLPATGEAGVALQFLLEGGEVCAVEVKRTANEAAAQVGVGDAPAIVAPLPAEGGTFRVATEVSAQRVKLSVTVPGASSALFSDAADLPFDIRELRRIRLVAFSTTGETTWLDDLEIAAVYAVAQPRVPAAPKLVKVTPATSRSLVVQFTGQDTSVLRYVIEARSLGANGKWSRWRPALNVQPRRGTSDFSATIAVLATASRHQVRVQAENAGGKAVSRTLTLTPPRKKPPTRRR